MSATFSSIVSKVENLFDFIISPNPVVKGKNIQLDFEANSTKFNSIFIYNIDGKMIKNIENNSKEFELNTEKLSSGIYFIQTVNAEGKSITKKLIVE